MIAVLLVKIIIVIIAVVACAFLINKLEEKVSNTMSFREALALAELPVVTFYQGDKKLNLLLDTGANISIIDKEVASTINTKETPRVSKITGIGGSVKDVAIVDIVLQYKNNTFKDGFQVTDMSSTFSAIKNATGVTVHGIIGNKFMQKYKYILDFDKMIAYSKK